MRIDRRSLLGIAGVVLAGGGTATATQMTNSDDDSVSAGDVSLSEQKARDIATGKVDGTVREVELESEDGTPVYEVEVEAPDGTVTEVAVHANNGTVLETETEDEHEDEDENEDDEEEESVAPGEVSLSEQKAQNVATGEVDGTVREIELEREDGTPVYEVEVEAPDGTVTEVAVHANNGTVLETETEDEHEDEDGDEHEDEDGDDDSGM